VNAAKVGGIVVLGLMALVAGPVLGAAAGGAVVEHVPAIWADGTLYGTIGTPAVISGHHDLSFFDSLVKFTNSNSPDGQAPIAQYAPGDQGYHGGNWAAYTATWTSSGFTQYGGTVPTLTTYADVQSNVQSGYLTVTLGDPSGGATYFRCPLVAA
jgi:hypothetical protein